MEQSKYRIKRIGQYRDIKYTYILTKLGIIDLIFNNINKKQKLEDLVKEKIKIGGIEKWIKRL
jgi:SNF2 family DNA or RNA helicase